MPFAAGNPVVAACCLAVCGPVADERFMCGPPLEKQPPTTWKSHVDDLTKGLSCGLLYLLTMKGDLEGVILKACLINDFIGVGLGLTAVDPSDVVTVHDVERNPRGPMVGIGAGTGLGEV